MNCQQKKIILTSAIPIKDSSAIICSGSVTLISNFFMASLPTEARPVSVLSRIGNSKCSCSNLAVCLLLAGLNSSV